MTRTSLAEAMQRRGPTARRIRTRLAFGLSLAAAAGAALAHASTCNTAAWWWAGALTALPAGLLLLSGLQLSRSLGKDPPRRLPHSDLGALLVAKGSITDGQLGNALARQYYTKRPLGQILVEMGAITPVQLTEVLGEQGLEVAHSSSEGGRAAREP